jgi:hypothetical protein
MLRKNRHIFVWYVFVVAIALIAILPDANWIYRAMAAYDSNRWVHFLEYAMIAAIPVGAWGRRTDVAISFIPVFLCIVFEVLHMHIPGPIARTSNISADLFGVAAGILLGMNIRLIRSSEMARDNGAFDPSRSEKS